MLIYQTLVREGGGWISTSPPADEEAFRRDARAWLAANVPDAPLPSLETGPGFVAHRTWEARLAADGWSVVSWPEAYGGRGASLQEWLIFEEEYYAAGAPGRVSQSGISLLAPTLFAHGTEEQRARVLPSMASGEVIWAQASTPPPSPRRPRPLRRQGRLLRCRPHRRPHRPPAPRRHRLHRRVRPLPLDHQARALRSAWGTPAQCRARVLGGPRTG